MKSSKPLSFSICRYLKRFDSDHEDADSAESEDTSADKDKKKSEDADVATKDTDAAIPEQEDTQE